MKSDSLWKTCEDCGKQFSVKAKSCPQCGKGGRRFSRLKWFGGGFAALVIATAIFGSGEAEKGVLVGNSTPSASASAVKSTAAPLPERQTSFIAAISDYKTRFDAAGNELQQSVLRDERRMAILKAVGGQLRAEGWLGTLLKLETNGDGNAIVIVRVAPNIDLATWNNAMSDILHSTLIEKGTPLYASLVNMSAGDRVKVSGNFIRAEADGLFEQSITIRGAMTAPEFLFKFTDISKQ
ncbi:zinc ribbon domain-containing protein [Agrobacterium tumefaciens]|uniref:zinc ribbon domain-containing protein n=1 Tax=Agrobacterium tumefaciens TaxID=358 RepID=UPI001572A4F2|nr:zinc ribbon domain-containing protein [Agrobacterium tumefaciens]NTB99099.1 zinc ribbon domain-containing protein [Agrobacterium tumefaciens]NTC45046.1 zinc ribbon domain-containing protein [Agrobacterium tumefaciens]